MDLELSGKIALVTGASMGIGREIARVMAAEGAQTVVVARRGNLLAKLQDEVEQKGSKRPYAITADLYDRDVPARVREQVLQHFGHIDILVNNAGGARPLPVYAPDEAWDESFALNFTAVRKMTQEFLPVMRERGWGRIINIIGSTTEPRSVNAASAAKAGVLAWAKGLSRDIAKDGVTVNCVAPGSIHSEQIDTRMHPTAENQAQFAKANIPVGHFGEPYDVAYMVAFLASPKARFVNGMRVHVDGGRHYAI